MILNPYYQELLDWADSILSFYEMSGTSATKLNDPKEWQDWAMQFVGDPDNLGQNAPTPYEFDDWREWASRLFQTFDLTG